MGPQTALNRKKAGRRETLKLTVGIGMMGLAWILYAVNVIPSLTMAILLIPGAMLCLKRTYYEEVD